MLNSSPSRQTWLVAFVGLSVVLALMGCRDPARDVPSATVEQPSTQTAEGADDGAGELQTLTINPATSSISWVGSKVTGSHDGGFRTFTGTISFDPENIARSRVNVTIDMNTVFSDNDNLTEHLKNDDFFDVPNHPEATFVGTELRPSTGQGTHTMVGDLTMRGTTQRISFPATLAITDAEVHATAEFSINRMDFGVAYAGRENDLIRELVVIKLDVRAPRS